MAIHHLKEIFRPTFTKIIITIILIIIFILGRRIAAQSIFPTENILFKIDVFIFKPADYIAKLFNYLNLTYLGNIAYFVVNLAEYYLMACLITLGFKKIENKV